MKRNPGKKDKIAQKKHRTLIVDDHPILREAIARLIEREPDMMVCGEAANCSDALKIIDEEKPDAVILDISLRNESGITLIGSIMNRAPTTRIMMLSMHDELIYAERCLRAGAAGYVMKSAPPSTIIDGIRTILAGQIFVSDKLKDLIIREVSEEERPCAGSAASHLTNREMQVFRSIAQGLTTKEISVNLKLSAKTIQTFREHIKKKLGIRNTTELIHSAVKWSHSDSSGES